MRRNILMFVFLSMLIFPPCKNTIAQPKEDSWPAYINETIVCGMMPLISVKGSNQDIQKASLNVSGKIDAQSTLGKLFLSQGLSLVVEKCTFNSPSEMGRIYSDRVVYSLGQNWVAPFNMVIGGKKQPPQVSFKNGEIIWNKNKEPALSVKEGTLSKVREALYVYKSGKWQLK